MTVERIVAARVSPDVTILLDRFGSGGVERVACHVANGLQRRGLGVEMLVLEDTGPVRPLLSEHVSVRVLGHKAAGLARKARMSAAVPAIAEYLDEARPGLFHAPGNHTIRHAARAVQRAGFAGPFVAKVTNPLLDDRMGLLQRLQRRFTYRQALRAARLILVLTQRGANDVAAIDPSLLPRTHVVHNPYVSDEMFGRAAGRKPTDPPVILSIGRLSEQKNQALLLRAAARLRDRHWRLRICGTGPEEGALRELAETLGISEKVDFAGFVADPVPEYLSAAVMALSSRWEGLPAAAIEAIACGCPVIATASSPGLVAFLKQVGARDAVALGDEAGFAEALEAALENRLPVVPPSAALPYSIEAACEEHAALFESLLDGTRGYEDGGRAGPPPSSLEWLDRSRQTDRPGIYAGRVGREARASRGR